MARNQGKNWNFKESSNGDRAAVACMRCNKKATAETKPRAYYLLQEQGCPHVALREEGRNKRGLGVGIEKPPELVKKVDAEPLTLDFRVVQVKDNTFNVVFSEAHLDALRNWWTRRQNGVEVPIAPTDLVESFLVDRLGEWMPACGCGQSEAEKLVRVAVPNAGTVYICTSCLLQRGTSPTQIATAPNGVVIKPSAEATIDSLQKELRRPA